MFATNQSPRILKPVKPWFIVATLILALLLNLLPLQQWLFMPDWVMLALAFWSVREWRHVGLGWAFALGLLMDVADASALGQHALAYVLLGYGASSLSRRLLWFSLSLQALHVLPLFLVATSIQAAIRMIAGDMFPGWGIFVTPFLVALLWPIVSFFLLIPQYQPEERDENRPI
ncbi:MAG: rod shape-determining protein MreD [Zoogloeaceae bacterium]|jgi:rod shape-determining protein MreD|nr:rod shape-determining protein MreD [Zoogloeaceae bacterium]